MSEFVQGNPLLLDLEPVVEIDRIIEDPRQRPEARYYKFEVKRLEGYEVIEAESLWNELMMRFVSSKDREHVPPTVNGKMIQPSAGACQIVAYLYTAQRDKKKGFTVDQLFLMMLSPRLLKGMSALVTDIQPKEDSEDLGTEDGVGWKTVDPLEPSGATS